MICATGEQLLIVAVLGVIVGVIVGLGGWVFKR
jgi:LPXTG-motif cell wall-anchored protein